MTREEAIIILTNTAFLLRDGTRYMKLEHEKQFREAYEMAIKALEQPEIIRCKDCEYNNASRNSGNAECTLFYGMNDQLGFCHHAERREDE